MILPEVLVSQDHSWRAETLKKEVVMKKPLNRQRGMTVNVLTTMVVTFVVAAAALLALAASTMNQAIVGGALAMAAGFVNLLRRPPKEADGCE